MAVLCSIDQTLSSASKGPLSTSRNSRSLTTVARWTPILTSPTYNIINPSAMKIKNGSSGSYLHSRTAYRSYVSKLLAFIRLFRQSQVKKFICHTSILLSKRSEIYELAYFPPTKYRQLVQNIVVSLHPPDYLNRLIEGTTLFTSLGNINDLSTLHELCIQFFNVTLISLPSSWLTTGSRSSSSNCTTFKSGRSVSRSFVVIWPNYMCILATPTVTSWMDGSDNFLALDQKQLPPFGTFSRPFDEIYCKILGKRWITVTLCRTILVDGQWTWRCSPLRQEQI